MKQETMKVVSQKTIAPNIFLLTLSGNLVNQMKQPGQFIHIKVPREDLLLRRPISINLVDEQKKECQIIYRIEGDGTESLSKLKSGDNLDVLGPLGNGYDVSFIQPNDEVLLVGGGIGTPPLYEVARQLKEKGALVTSLLGFASKEVVFFEEEFKEFGDTYISTDDGSYGVHGHIGNLLDMYVCDKEIKAIYSCGSKGLLTAVDERFHSHPHAYVSLESRMACGLGACYACVVHEQGDSTQTKSKKVCDEGPVFKTGEVVL